MAIDIAAALALSKNALDIVMAVRKAIREKQKLTDEQMRDYLDTLQDKLVDVKTALMEAAEENRTLQNRIDELVRYSDIGKEFNSDHGLYWYEGYPYCPTCWDVDRKPVRLAGPTVQTTVRWYLGRVHFTRRLIRCTSISSPV